jgi:hypothetical protein
MKMNINPDSMKELMNFSIFKTFFNSKIPFFLGDKSLSEEEGTLIS